LDEEAEGKDDDEVVNEKEEGDLDEDSEEKNNMNEDNNSMDEDDDHRYCEDLSLVAASSHTVAILDNVVSPPVISAVSHTPVPLTVNETPPLMGSSRISGGFSRGLSHGNVPNHADLIPTSIDLEMPVKGEVCLYMTDQYPRNVKFEDLKGDSDLVVMVKVVGSMAPILVMVARKFPDIQSECLF
jgi:hypothetical protein